MRRYAFWIGLTAVFLVAMTFALVDTAHEVTADNAAQKPAEVEINDALAMKIEATGIVANDEETWAPRATHAKQTEDGVVLALKELTIEGNTYTAAEMNALATSGKEHGAISAFTEEEETEDDHYAKLKDAEVTAQKEHVAQGEAYAVGQHIFLMNHIDESVSIQAHNVDEFWVTSAAIHSENEGAHAVENANHVAIEGPINGHLTAVTVTGNESEHVAKLPMNTAGQSTTFNSDVNNDLTAPAEAAAVAISTRDIDETHPRL